MDHVFFKILFTYFQRGMKGGRKRGRETSMCERNINWLPFTCPQLGTWPTTQACALTQNQTNLQDAAQPTEPHHSKQDGSCCLIYSSTLCLLIGSFNSLTFTVIIIKYVLLAILMDFFVVFPILNVSCSSLLACQVATEKSADSLMGFPLNVTHFLSCFIPDCLFIFNFCHIS